MITLNLVINKHKNILAYVYWNDIGVFLAECKIVRVIDRYRTHGGGGNLRLIELRGVLRLVCLLHVLTHLSIW